MQHLSHDIVMESHAPRVALVALQWSVTPRKPVLLRSYDEPVSGDPLCGPPPGRYTRLLREHDQRYRSLFLFVLLYTLATCF